MSEFQQIGEYQATQESSPVWRTLCRTCKDYVSDEHQCYMHPASVNDVKKRNTNGLTADDGKQNEEDIKTFIFFDFECTQDDLLHCHMGYEP